MNIVYLILHKLYDCTFHFKNAYKQVKAKYLKVSFIVYYSQTNHNDVAIIHAKTTLDLPVMYSYCMWHVAIAFIKYLTTFVKSLT